MRASDAITWTLNDFVHKNHDDRQLHSYDFRRRTNIGNHCTDCRKSAKNDDQKMLPKHTSFEHFYWKSLHGFGKLINFT